jgi:4-hydroxyphenylacetate 3-monooxygenase
VVVLDRVEIPWSRVFVVPGDVARSYTIYIRTPAHALANHQATIRSAAKVQLLVGVAERLAGDSGTREQPVVRDLLGRLAAMEATIEALVEAQAARPESWPGGLAPWRRYVYAALEWCQRNLSIAVEAVRELLGSAPFRQPDPVPVARLAWDLIGSEFAGRQQHYEHFYAGPPFVVHDHNLREAPWGELSSLVDRAITQQEKRE